MKDFKKIEADLKLLPPSKQELAQKLLSKAVFMDAELENLQKILKEKGWVEQYKHGENQYGLKKASEGEVYTTLIKSYNATMRQIADLLEAVANQNADDDVMAYLKGGQKLVSR